MTALSRFLRKFIRVGSLTVIDADGQRHRFGDSNDLTTPDVIARISDRLLYLKLAINPEFYLGEAYIDGTLSIEQGTLWDFLDLRGRNLAHSMRWRGWLFIDALNRLRQLATQYNNRDQCDARGYSARG